MLGGSDVNDASSVSSQTTTNSSGTNTPNLDKKPDYLCKWDQCGEIVETSADLADHLTEQHAQTQLTGKKEKKYFCLWDDCKVRKRPSSSREWLLRHILIHSGDKPFRCLFTGCNMAYSTRDSRARHVQSHFSEQSSPKMPKNKDDSPGKYRRKRTRYKRRVSQVKRTDFFDTQMMDALQHHLVTVNMTTQLDTKGHGRSIIFQGMIKCRRTADDGKVSMLIHWQPEDILPDTWVSEDQVTELSHKSVRITDLPKDTLNQIHPNLTRFISRRRKAKRK
ncbi:zinc finger protein AEBP2-like [Anneissia japonica]|uniref:zinc finger protein AEBP2-like n=1 Tax=Anneissia japonica TaxID=1529436 RepID=UPI001425528E|nr:zinc finger protein AEBP2-like [Anneissia japonica]